MADDPLTEKQSRTSLTRLLPKLEERYQSYAQASPQEWAGNQDPFGVYSG